MILKEIFVVRMLPLKLQACRKYRYSNSIQDEHEQKLFTKVDHLREARQYLIHLMSSHSLFVDKDSGGLPNGDKRLLEEIEMFFRTLTVEDDR